MQHWKRLSSRNVYSKVSLLAYSEFSVVLKATAQRLAWEICRTHSLQVLKSSAHSFAENVRGFVIIKPNELNALRS